MTTYAEVMAALPTMSVAELESIRSTATTLITEQQPTSDSSTPVPATSTIPMSSTAGSGLIPRPPPVMNAQVEAVIVPQPTSGKGASGLIPRPMPETNPQ